MDKKPSLKIISGKFKGRSLKMAPINITRSSKSILKESLFNTLASEIVDINFVEFFAGSGSIGIEALSRGAKYCIFFEKHKESCKILEENLESLCQKNEYKIVFGDTFSFYSNTLKELQGDTIGYFDPPFDIRQNMQDIYEKCFDVIKNLDTKIFKIIILEHISSLNLPKEIGSFTHFKTKKFGKSSLSYFLA